MERPTQCVRTLASCKLLSPGRKGPFMLSLDKSGSGGSERCSLLLGSGPSWIKKDFLEFELLTTMISCSRGNKYLSCTYYVPSTMLGAGDSFFLKEDNFQRPPSGYIVKMTPCSQSQEENTSFGASTVPSVHSFLIPDLDGFCVHLLHETVSCFSLSSFKAHGAEASTLKKFSWTICCI